MAHQLMKRELLRLQQASKKADQLMTIIEDIKARHPRYENLTSQVRQLAATLRTVLDTEEKEANKREEV